MRKINRREFLYNGAAISAATALAPHTLATTGEGVLWATHAAIQNARRVPGERPFTGRDYGIVNWREQGLNLSGRTVHYRDSFR